jgi:hypothetical protein
MLEFRHMKLDAINNQLFESAGGFRAAERRLEREVMSDYMKSEKIAIFRISNQDKKEISCYLYSDMLTSFFKFD